MSGKTLNEANLQTELGASAFFQPAQAPQAASPVPPPTVPAVTHTGPKPPADDPSPHMTHTTPASPDSAAHDGSATIPSTQEARLPEALGSSPSAQPEVNTAPLWLDRSSGQSVPQASGSGQQPVDPSTHRVSSQSTGRPTNRSRQWPTSDTIDQPSGRVVSRPKAFYITTRLDERIDRAVRYFQEEHGITKADRSTVLNVLLDREEFFRDESLDELVARVIGQLTSRLTS